MATEKSTAGAPLQPFGNVEWVKSFSEAPVKIYSNICREALDATARRLQVHANYVKKLSECDGPADALTCHGEFVQGFVLSFFEDGRRAFETWREAISPPGPK